MVGQVAKKRSEKRATRHISERRTSGQQHSPKWARKQQAVCVSCLFAMCERCPTPPDRRKNLEIMEYLEVGQACS